MTNIDQSGKDSLSVENITSEFIAVAAHELRTPMTSIKANVSLLLTERFGPLTDSQRKALVSIDRNVGRLVRFTNDIIQLSRIESGRFNLKRESIRLLPIVNRVISEFSAEMNDAGLTLSQDISNDLIAVCDEDKLVEVIRNLIDNAVKYADRGSEIRIKAWNEDDECHISVSNRGKEIPDDKLPLIFNKFYQCDGVDSAVHQGTGLGLSICRGIVKAMGGYIWASNRRDGQGVTIEFTLPR